jgi:predicted RNase H-like HicB family nuclease
MRGETLTTNRRRITLTEEDDWWIAKDENAGEHGVASQGRTREEALENLDEAIDVLNDEGRPPTDEELREIGIDPEENRRRGEGDRELPDVLK